MRHEKRKKAIYRFGAAVDDARKAAGAPFQMKAQRERVYVMKGLNRNLAQRVIDHFGKNRVTNLSDGLHHNSGATVSDNEGERYSNGDGQRIGLNIIDRAFQQKRHCHGH